MTLLLFLSHRKRLWSVYNLCGTLLVRIDILALILSGGLDSLIKLLNADRVFSILTSLVLISMQVAQTCLISNVPIAKRRIIHIRRSSTKRGFEWFSSFKWGVDALKLLANTSFHGLKFFLIFFNQAFNGPLVFLYDLQHLFNIVHALRISNALNRTYIAKFFRDLLFLL